MDGTLLNPLLVRLIFSKYGSLAGDDDNELENNKQTVNTTTTPKTSCTRARRELFGRSIVLRWRARRNCHAIDRPRLQFTDRPKTGTLVSAAAHVKTGGC